MPTDTDTSVKIYAGPDLATIDWDRPIASAEVGASTASVVLPAELGGRCVLAARAVDEAGRQENGTAALLQVRLDEQGNLAPALDAPRGLSAGVQGVRLVASFSYSADGGFARAEALELLCDYGCGELDLERPLASLLSPSAGAEDFQVDCPCPPLPALLAVRARAGETTGPLSEVITVPAPAPVQAPDLL